MFVQRLISGIVLLAIIIGAIVAGNVAVFGLVLFISVVGMYELYRVAGIHNSILGWVGYLCTIALDVLLFLKYERYLLIFIVALLLLLMITYVLSYPKYHSNQIAFAFFGFVYVTVMLSFIYQIRTLPDGFYMIWLVFIGAWGSDTCAYCIGMLIGKHKLPNELSPKKSIEGCIGGVVGAALIGAIYAAVFKDHFTQVSNPVVGFAIIGAASSVLSQIGDLAASGIKRNYQIKDYGTLIPGHGGIMDRFDSIIFTAPIVYILLLFL